MKTLDMKYEQMLAVAKSLILTTPEVQAVQDGRKTMKRMVIKPQPVASLNKYPNNIKCYDSKFNEFKPRYRLGDTLYVRETWRESYEHPATQFEYKADPPRETDYITPFEWRPSIHMPKEAARIFLRVTDVRVERLQEITEEDAVREGCAPMISTEEKIVRPHKQQDSRLCGYGKD